MADPQHTPHMSALDNFTVVLYRIGLGILSVATALFIGEYFLKTPLLQQHYFSVFAIGTALASANVHLYDVRFRWFIPFMGWMGCMLLAVASGMPDPTTPASHVVKTGALGFFYAGAGMFAVKEQFCFKIPGLQSVPLFLAASVLCRFFHLPMLEVALLIPAAVLLLILSIAKWRMPLHFDVGDKSKYTM